LRASGSAHPVHQRLPLVARRPANGLDRVPAEAPAALLVAAATAAAGGVVVVGGAPHQ